MSHPACLYFPGAEHHYILWPVHISRPVEGRRLSWVYKSVHCSLWPKSTLPIICSSHFLVPVSPPERIGATVLRWTCVTARHRQPTAVRTEYCLESRQLITIITEHCLKSQSSVHTVTMPRRITRNGNFEGNFHDFCRRRQTSLHCRWQTRATQCLRPTVLLMSTVSDKLVIETVTSLPHWPSN